MNDTRNSAESNEKETTDPDWASPVKTCDGEDVDVWVSPTGYVMVSVNRGATRFVLFTSEAEVLAKRIADAAVLASDLVDEQIVGAKA